MSKGYIVIAQNNGEYNYIEQAYALALSIKNTQSKVNQFAICVEPGTNIPKKYKKVFDYVVDIPWKDHAKDAKWKINNKWKYYYATPFEESVILDTDMIFTTDVSYWWDFLSQKDVWATTNVKTFRGEQVDNASNPYRKVFVNNDLPNVYTAFFYFKKTQIAAELFKLTEYIFNNWERFYFEFIPKDKPNFLSGDVAFALAMQILGIEDECTNSTITEMPTFVHMKSKIQKIPQDYLDENWTKQIPTYLSNNGDLKVGNFQQIYPFHYHVKEWLTKDIIEKLEMIYENR